MGGLGVLYVFHLNFEIKCIYFLVIDCASVEWREERVERKKEGEVREQDGGKD